MKRVAVYIRVSSDQQAKEGDSIPAQQEALRKFVAERPDMILVGEYIDDGISGQKYVQRDELQRLLEDVKQGEIDVIAFTKLDRWFRSVRHYTATQEILDRHNVSWLAIWEPIYDTTTPSGRLIVNQMMSIAQFEAENTGQRIRQVFDYKVQKGEAISGTTPLGYSIVDKHLVPNEDADMVKAMFKRYSMTGSLNDLSRFMADEYGYVRAKNSLKRTLRQKKYIGVFRDNPNYCEPIIDKDLFMDVQRKLDINVKRSQKHVYLFSGLLKCKECGASLAGNNSKGRPGRYVNYRCPKYYQWGHRRCTNKKAIWEPTLEKYLLDNIAELSREYTVETKEKKADTAKLKARQKRLTEKIDRLKELFVSGLISIDEYRADKEVYIKELESIQGAVSLSKGRKGKDPKRISQSALKLYHGFTDEEKRYFWRSIISHITWSEEKEIKVFFLD